MVDAIGSDASVWAATVSSEFRTATLEDDLACDVAVVGAGFTGLRAALALAEAGTDVVVLDAVDVGFGASGRSGGQVNPMLPVERPDDLLRAVGPTCFERLAEVSLNSADELFALVRKHGIDCAARQNGWLRVDHCAAAGARARTAATAWNRHGMDFEFLDGPEVDRLSGAAGYVSGTFTRKGGAVQPLSLVRGLARAAQASGARIFKQAQVAGLARSDGRWQLETNGRRISADRVLLASNGYTGTLLPRLRRTILPLSPIQIATDPLPEEMIQRILPGGLTISDTRRVIMYARREPENRVVYGGIGYRMPTGEVGGFDWLERDAARVFPALRDVTWRYRWGGQIAITPDRLPHFHEPAPGLVAGLGYNGRGVAMSLVMGRVLAERLLGAEAGSLPFPLSPLKPMPFRDIQVFGAGLAIGWMRLLDRLEVRRAC